MNKAKKIIIYIISTLLIASYFVILIIAFHPSVSAEYSLFYLKHELKFMPPKDGLNVILGVNLYFDNSTHDSDIFWGIGKAWNCPNSLSSDSNVDKFSTGLGDNKLYFCGLDNNVNYTLTLYLNETNATKIVFRSDNFEEEICNFDNNSELSIAIPSQAINNNSICITITPLDNNNLQDRAYFEYVRLDK